LGKAFLLNLNLNLISGICSLASVSHFLIKRCAKVVKSKSKCVGYDFKTNLKEENKGMKKILSLIMCLAFVVVMLAACGQQAAPAAETKATEAAKPAETTKEAPKEETKPAAPAAKKAIGYFKAAADDYYKAGWDVFKALADKEGWDTQEVLADGSDAKMLSAVEDFITQKKDAIVCVQTTAAAGGECAKKAKEAGVPFFSLTHQPQVTKGFEPTGASCYDWVTDGTYAGKSAIEHNVKNVIIIEGVQGQGTAAAQTVGFLQAYKDAGKQVKVVFTGYGQWFAQGGQKAMDEAIAAVGAKGFDGLYVHNDEMLDGVLNSMKNAGLDPSKYWIGASNGKEKSWKWVKDGLVTMDVNQTPTLEADLVFQMIKAQFEGKPYKHYVYSILKPFTKDNMDGLVPYVKDDYLAGRDAKKFIFDINDPAVKEWSFQ